jgi:hypothetical protein
LNDRQEVLVDKNFRSLQSENYKKEKSMAVDKTIEAT